MEMITPLRGDESVRIQVEPVVIEGFKEIMTVIHHFIHEDKSEDPELYSVSEFTTGQSLSGGFRFWTKSAAIESAKRTLEQHGKEAVLLKISGLPQINHP